MVTDRYSTPQANAVHMLNQNTTDSVNNKSVIALVYSCSTTLIPETGNLTKRSGQGHFHHAPQTLH